MPEFSLPDGVYLSLANVVRARFGGQTRAHLMRNRFFTTYAGVPTTILTLDSQPVYPLERRRLTERGELVPGMRLLNIFEHYREDDLVADAPQAARLAAPSGLAAVDVAHPDGSVHYTAYREPETEDDVVRDYRRADGTVYVRTPGPTVVKHPVPYVLADASGRAAHTWPTRRGWGHHWLQHLAGDASRVFVISDSREALLPLLPLSDERFHVLHLVHNVHLAAERRWNSPLSPTYGPLFARLEELDALVTLTRRQRRDIAERYGARKNLHTVSNPVTLPRVPEPLPPRDPALFTIVSRFETQKRLDHAVRAFALVVAERPHARLAIYGQGTLRESLEQLVAELGVGASIELRGWDPDARETLWGSSGFLVTSGFEGYPLATLEALSRGCPVISYDIKYGPREQVTDGVDGYLVGAEDVRAMADRVVALLDDPGLVARLSAAALAKAEQHDHRAFLSQWNRILTAVVTAKPRRASLTHVRCTVRELGYLPDRLRRRLARLTRRGSAVHSTAAVLEESRPLVFRADLEVRGDLPKGSLRRAAVTLDAVSKTTEQVTPLPLTVERVGARFRLSSTFSLRRVFAGRPPEDRALTLRLRLVVANACWETVVARPPDTAPAFEVGYGAGGQLQLRRGGVAGGAA